MGLLDFVKDAGAYLFGSGAGTAVAKEQAKPVSVDVLKQQIETLGITVDGLDVSFADPVATVKGAVASQSDREKVVLGIGNTPGVGRVDDRLTVKGATAGGEAKLYTVKKGDTLSAIAKAQLGDAAKYPSIFDANKPMLKDPNKIYPGQVLRIPAGT